MEYKVFFSSRCDDKIKFKNGEEITISALRYHVKDKLENQNFLGQNIFKILINEEFTLNGASEVYDACLSMIDEADLNIVLYNEQAGWASSDGSGIGICHAECDYAFTNYPKKSFLIQLKKPDSDFKFEAIKKFKSESENSADRNLKFKTYISSLKHNLPAFKKNITREEYLEVIYKVLCRIILSNIEERIKLSNDIYNLKGSLGETLNWIKLPYRTREKLLNDILKKNKKIETSFEAIQLNFGAIPDAMSVPEAREKVGRIFLKDMEILKDSKKESGVLHIIAVYKTTTERQLRNLVGHPDVTIIQDTFGWYVYEMETHIQMVFLTDCSNESTTNTRVEQFFEWLKKSREFSEIEKRAKARFMVLKAMKEAIDFVKK